MRLRLVALGLLGLYGLSDGQQTNSTVITCFNYDGTPFPDNVQCSGSSVCCGSSDECVSQRFCERDGTLIRPVCTSYPWDENSCSGLCFYGSFISPQFLDSVED